MRILRRSTLDDVALFAYSAVSIIISRISWCLGINEGALHARYPLWIFHW